VAGGNSLIFTFGFEDNVNAGNKIVVDGNDTINQFVRYTNTDGTLDTFNFDLAHAFVADDSMSINEVATIAKKLPEIDPEIVYSVLVSTDYFKLMKDPAEILKMTYQLQVVAKRGMEDVFIVGKELTNKNPLVTYYPWWNTDPKTFIFTVSTEKYGKFENKKAKGVAQSIGFTIDYSTGYIQIDDFQDATGLMKSWALSDIHGNLYIACNDINIRRVYFNFKNKRGV